MKGKGWLAEVAIHTKSDRLALPNSLEQDSTSDRIAGYPSTCSW